MSRYLMLALAVLSLTLTACGKDSDNKDKPSQGRTLDKTAFPNVPQTAFGQWQGRDELENGVFVSPSLYVNQDSIGLEVSCRRGADRITVAFAVKANVSADTIQILETARRSAGAGSIASCTADLPAGRYGYSVNGNVLTLDTGDKSRIQFNRIF